MSIGERISDLRKQKKLSQADLAEALEVSRQAVSKWESDLSSPDTMRLIQLAEVLDTEVEYLATGRRSMGRRLPVVIKTVETVEKIVEKPVVEVVERVVDRVIEKPVIHYVEKPVVKKVVRTKYIRNGAELALMGTGCFFLGMIIGFVIGLC